MILIFGREKRVSQSNFNPYTTIPYYGYQQPFAGASAQRTTPYGVPPTSMPMQPVPTTGSQVTGMLPIEQSYIENILRLNKGKLVTVYATFEDKQQKKFEGIIEAAGRDHLIISDPQTGVRYLIPMVYLDYVVFSEPIEYEFPGITPPSGMLSQYSPR
ncbi:spore coat protein GerQ [Bacillus sp. FJAT-49705]|uniref:Spore coat protein GerQ n=1 Tax=Cytobacillus citreus TaxID=2833586 RepID=A0ABS5NQD9_9BACI|nr:spore coat protein GerQ [Cytobacillus citreus]MBS4190035.1 spore coat protein GerQ [Cytobacillus citreus]